ncbi:hypothetical protein FIV34_11525 [Luteibacter pinisoli]|uniref:Uncharacterized protein n=1 Tax=Luteibacter pinisoli TaxID=2589080 RepID=A0A4Y5Z3D5_9GAMM|nr:DUF6348 family protein [Luteibacter pinisoli]QDE39791.1 hypothetical protein FIV34_11525 [Luteibacter pinisoli]
MDWLKRLTSRPVKNKPEHTEPPGQVADPTEMLAHALRSHGIEVTRVGDVLLLPGDLGLKASVHDVPSANPGTYMVGYELIALSPLTANKPVFSSMFGHGDSREKAITNSFVKTMIGPLHVMLEALANHVCDPPRTTLETWVAATASWNVFEGQVVTEESEGWTHSLTSTYREHGWPALRRMFEATQGRGHHSISVTLASFNSEVSGIDILLDDEPWVEAVEHFQTLPWQTGAGYESARHFAIALDKDPAP